MFKHGFPPEWSTLKKLIWLVGSGIAGAASGIWKTVTGTLIHITDALASPMQKCEVTLEPIQDLHGQDAPYPAGGGKNKIDVPTTTIASGGGSTGNVPCLVPSGTYTFSVSVSTNAAWQVRLRNANGENIVAANSLGSGGRQSVTVNLSETAYFVNAYFNTETVASEFQLESGSTATAYSPYSNICPITGWTGCEVNRTGVNLFDKSYYSDYSNYTKPFSNYYFAKLQLKPNTAYVFNPSSTARLDTNRYYVIRIITGSDPDDLSNSSFVYPISSGTPSKTQFTTGKTGAIWFGVYYQDGADTLAEFMSIDWQLELGSTATEYEPYSGTTLSVTFPDTVYGGSHEFVSGGLTPKKVLLTLNGNSTDGNYSRISSGRFNIDNLPINYLRNESAADSGESSQYKSLPKTSTNGQFDTLAANYSAAFNVSLNLSRNTLRIKDTRFDTVAELQAAYAIEKPQFALTLATPTEISLTPQEISTLKGVNNVWSNGDSVEITYKAQAE